MVIVIIVIFDNYHSFGYHSLDNISKQNYQRIWHRILRGVAYVLTEVIILMEGGKREWVRRRTNKWIQTKTYLYLHSDLPQSNKNSKRERGSWVRGRFVWERHFKIGLVLSMEQMKQCIRSWISQKDASEEGKKPTKCWTSGRLVLRAVVRSCSDTGMFGRVGTFQIVERKKEWMNGESPL